MAQIHPALGASARMTWKVVSFPLIAGLLLLKPQTLYTSCGFRSGAVAFELSAGSAVSLLQIAGMAGWPVAACTTSS